MSNACVRMVGPDERMDENKNGPVNLLPVKCPHCTFPDLDFVSKPYLLAKGFVCPAETSNAYLGNFLVRERVKAILECVVPEACTFYETAELKSKKATPWWLAVPNQKLPTVQWVHQPLPPRCSKCGQPRNDWGDKPEEMVKFDSGGVDVFKSLTWNGATLQEGVESHNRHLQEQGKPPLPWSHWGVEPPPHAEYWTRRCDRRLYFSVRLEQLLKRAKVKGQLTRLLDFKDVKPSLEDRKWIDEKYNLLVESGLLDAPKPSAGKVKNLTQKWFNQFLKKNASNRIENIDFVPIEQKHKLALPQEYKDFISAIGEKSFADVKEMEGSTTTILQPNELDFKSCRAGKVPDLDKDDAGVDGVMFATVDSGDVFVFDVRSADGSYPVYFYNHEENLLEPFAPNFAECIKRFVQRN